MMAVSRTFLIPLIVACALFMENMDATVITTSLPVLAQDLGQQPITLKLALTAYVVGLGVFIPICGWVADRFGARTVFRAAIGVFMAGSLLCAVSSSLLTFVAARFLQGIGGAMMVPVGRIVIFRSVPRNDLVKAISYLTIPAQLGPVIGPPLGGFITTYFHWRWIFLINIPISLLGIYLAGRFIENFKEENLQPLDVKGFILSAIGSTLLMLGMSLIDGELLSAKLAFAMCVVGVAFLLLYLRHARTVPFPLLDLSLLRIPTFRASVLAGSLFRIGLGAVPFLLPLSLQIGLGMSAFHAGTITCASAFGAIFMKAIGTTVLRRFGFRSVLMWNALLAALALASYGLFTPTTPYLVMMVVVLLGGFFPSMQFTCFNSMAYADLDGAEVSRATSLSSVVQQISLGLGVTIGGLAIIFSSRIQGHATVVAADFWPAFIVIALFSLSSIPLARRLPLDAGAALTGHVARKS
ncbi:MFS transporter [Glaciimonas sp. PCH181]|uniref:MFS transporter n=1 Tax=Glaciimonas sp. PCH181 TaxID=2133943 RepID=UPI000D373E5A|nr:MFS transporter [Glaciimonas sp. PCH181]PUA16544.1 MFS transporter [Glaciimonas sp. PCH181]